MLSELDVVTVPSLRLPVDVVNLLGVELVAVSSLLICLRLLFVFLFLVVFGDVSGRLGLLLVSSCVIAFCLCAGGTLALFLLLAYRHTHKLPESFI